MNDLTREKETKCPVNSFTEWDPLEEVIVGVVDFAAYSPWQLLNRATVTDERWKYISAQRQNWKYYPSDLILSAKKDLEELVSILIGEGIKVRRPDIVDYSIPYSTPQWAIERGFCSANPRDVFLVIGNEIIETPMADRARYFESWAYRSLLKEYFIQGAKWTSAPKPQLSDHQFINDFSYDHRDKYIITEFEPTFDAADFARCGKDIFGQKSHATNQFGIDWLERHLGDKYNVHLLPVRDLYALHIDTTFIPLCPGKVIVNPDYLDLNKLPDVLKSWEKLIPPKPIINDYSVLGFCENWISLNMLMLDEKRVIVEKEQKPLIESLKSWGFEPIPCSFKNYYNFGGSIHCATLDIRRRGELKSYF